MMSPCSSSHQLSDRISIRPSRRHHRASRRWKFAEHDAARAGVDGPQAWNGFGRLCRTRHRVAQRRDELNRICRPQPGAIACAARGVGTSVAGTAASVRRRVPRSSSFIAAAASAATASAARRARPSTESEIPRLFLEHDFTPAARYRARTPRRRASRIRRATRAAFDWLWLRAISRGCATWKMATARGGASSPPATRTSCSNESRRPPRPRAATPSRGCVAPQPPWRESPTRRGDPVPRAATRAGRSDWAFTRSTFRSACTAPDATNGGSAARGESGGVELATRAIDRWTASSRARRRAFKAVRRPKRGSTSELAGRHGVDGAPTRPRRSSGAPKERSCERSAGGEQRSSLNAHAQFQDARVDVLRSAPAPPRPRALLRVAPRGGCSAGVDAAAAAPRRRARGAKLTAAAPRMRRRRRRWELPRRTSWAEDPPAFAALRPPCSRRRTRS